MGQYYYPVSVEKKDYILSHDLKSTYTRKDGTKYTVGEGLKLMEHSYIGNKLMNAVERLLIPGGAWHKTKIVWAGDYADEEKDSEHNLHSIVCDEGTKLLPSTRKVSKKYRYLVNHTRKEVVDLSQVVEDESGYKIHPLSLLTVEGNGRGGGDFRGEDSRVGMWARDVISIEDTIPEGSIKVSGRFTETRSRVGMGDDNKGGKSLPDMVISI